MLLLIRVGAICLTALLVLFGSGEAEDCELIEALDGFAATGSAVPGATCLAYVTDAAQTGASCYWSHPYRDRAVDAHASDLWRTLTVCRPGHVLPRGSGVNHPDSYDLREWVYRRDVYALSIKDKAARGQTLIFLRIEPARFTSGH